MVGFFVRLSTQNYFSSIYLFLAYLLVSKWLFLKIIWSWFFKITARYHLWRCVYEYSNHIQKNFLCTIMRKICNLIGRRIFGQISSFSKIFCTLLSSIFDGVPCFALSIIYSTIQDICKLQNVTLLCSVFV